MKKIEIEPPFTTTHRFETEVEESSSSCHGI